MKAEAGFPDTRLLWAAVGKKVEGGLDGVAQCGCGRLCIHRMHPANQRTASADPHFYRRAFQVALDGIHSQVELLGQFRRRMPGQQANAHFGFAR